MATSAVAGSGVSRNVETKERASAGVLYIFQFAASRGMRMVPFVRCRDEIGTANVRY